MKKLLPIALTLLAFNASAKQVECYPKSEIGEDNRSTEHLYKRETDRFPKNTARIDFKNLTITDLQRNSVISMKEVGKNLYEHRSENYLCRYQTNDSKSIVIESSVANNTIYAKILFCK